LDKLTFDPVRNTVIRSNAPLFLNPFDERAALVAPTLKLPGEESVIVSMGPPEARAPITQALAHGSDRAILLSDRALAGSDTWVTARVLSECLRRLEPRLVLTGRWSTDSSTGQVPAQVAGFLGLPMLDGARRIEPAPDGMLTITVDTELGWARFRLAPPALLTVGEKIAKLRPASMEARQAAALRPFEVLGASDLGVPPSEIGLSGSPTRVVSVANDEPTRTPRLFDSGATADRVGPAVEATVELLARPGPPEPPFRPPPAEVPDGGEVLVFVSPPTGGVDPDALALLQAPLTLAEPYWPAAVGFGPLEAGDVDRLQRHGARRLYWSGGRSSWASPEGVAPLVRSVLERRPHVAAALFLSTPWSRELAGRISASLHLGLTGDAVGLVVDPDHGIGYQKPSFGGGLVAKVVAPHGPSLATIRPGSLMARPLASAPPAVERIELPGPIGATRLEPLDSRLERDPRYGRLGGARVVVGIGMGLGGPQAIDRLLEMVRPLNASIAASRRVVDSGWVPPQLQVGLTGASIAPDLYLAVGVSGQANHLVGVKRTRVLVGLNSDPRAPILRRADIGLVAPWEEALGPYAAELARRIPRLVEGPSAASRD
ncbi:MAG TPA: FAD-binding protein, partial [Thermoplasmata archaeon]|nr:FAD-binding protein [Thermoplasmata archaeon]